MRRRHLLAAPALLAFPAAAQSWPERPVTMVVPFAPGGTPDVAARLDAPKATPDLPVQRLHAALAEASKAPELQPRFADLGFDIVMNTPAEGDALLAREQAKWAALIKRAGIKADF